MSKLYICEGRCDEVAMKLMGKTQLPKHQAEALKMLIIATLACTIVYLNRSMQQTRFDLLFQVNISLTFLIYLYSTNSIHCVYYVKCVLSISFICVRAQNQIQQMG
jgi:hypothetical protein